MGAHRRGLLAPLRRDQKRDFASGNGTDLLRSKVIQALATEGDTPRSVGELPWTAFGSGLHLLRHQRNDEALAALAVVYAREALARWVPEVEVLAVVAARLEAELRLSIRYRDRLSGEIFEETIPIHAD
jgi:uncharacterized protein